MIAAVKSHALAALLLLSLFSFFAPAPSRAGELEPWVQELFQWGEYDSLTRSLEPWLAARSAGADGRADSVELSRANLFLGVAYFATEKPALGDQAFARACRLDSSARLDRFYATPEIIARFDSIAAKERTARRELAARAAAAAPTPSAGGMSGGANKNRKGLGWKGWAVGLLTTAGVAAGGGIAYYALLEKKPKVNEVTAGGNKD